MKKIAIIVFVCIFCIPLVAAARRDTGPPEWTFDDAADLADWRDSNGITMNPAIVKVKGSNGIERNVLRIVPTGDNPYIYPGGSVPNWEPFNGYNNGTIFIGLKVEKSDTWQVDYITGKNAGYGEATIKKFPVKGSSDFADLKFDMQWDGMIRGFRLHLGTNKNKPIEIDYVSLLAPVLVTQTPRKLATTWGSIKDLF